MAAHDRVFAVPTPGSAFVVACLLKMTFLTPSWSRAVVVGGSAWGGSGGCGKKKRNSRCVLRLKMKRGMLDLDPTVQIGRDYRLTVFLFSID